MRIAVLSDIHGFNLALETVLRDLDDQEPFDQIIVAGDLCEVGPAPQECLELLWARPFTVLMGNTDRDIVAAVRDGDATPAVRYVIDQIGADGLGYLAALPFDHRITPPGRTSPTDDLLVVHANPHDLNRQLHPDASDRDLRDVVGDTTAAAIAFGHVHICYTRQLDETLLVNVAAVGNAKGGDLRCKYGILTWDDAGHWRAELRKLEYPLTETEAQVMTSGLPDPDKALRNLKRAG